jgi:DNA primase
MSRVPRHIVDRIYAAMDIVEVVSDYVQLKKRGANYWALSPFVNERTPSFAVNPAKGIFKDFSSGKGGDAIAFLREIEGYSFVEALKHIARKYSIEIEEEEETPEQAQARDFRQSLLIVNEFAARFFQRQLLEAEEGRNVGLSYFKERGLLEATIRDFGLGYAPSAWDSLSLEAARQQHNEAFLLDLGLASRSEKTGKLVDRFRERVMFPIHDPAGKVIAFGGRILGSRKDIAKYMNSPESALYHKSEVLFGLYHAKKYLREKNLCILTEGYMDTLLLHQNEIRNVVASSGTALTPEQIRLIRRFTDQVLLIYDGDKAGIKAALRGIDLLIREGMSARVVVLPDNHDPDSYIRAVGREAFLEYLEREARNGIEFKIKALSAEGPPTPEKQAEILRAVAETLSGMPDRVQREFYLRHAAGLLGVNESLLALAVGESLQEAARLDQRQLRRELKAPEPAAPAPEAREVGKQSLLDRSFETLPLARQEEELLRVMVNHADKELRPEESGLEHNTYLIDYLNVELEGLSFENPVYEGLKRQMFAEFEQHQRISLPEYLHHEDSAINRLVASLLTVQETSPLWKRIRPDLEYDGDIGLVIRSALFHYKNRKVEALLAECRKGLKAAQESSDEARMDELLASHQYLLRIRREIHARLGVDGAVGGRDAVL